MKKKLLITLGCSYTEGVGCYEPVFLNKDGTPISEQDVNSRKVYLESRTRFHNFGWPSQLQKKLKYEYLWNLGYGGSSNSHAVKRWMELFSNKNLSEEYEVLVIWMVTFSDRISFYRNGQIFSMNSNPSQQFFDFYLSYVNFLGNNGNKDMMLETYFYVNLIQNICNFYNYKFLYINTNNKEGKLLDSLVQSPSSLNFLYKMNYPKSNGIIYDSINDNRAFCGHPNERGYEIVTEILFKLISEINPELINVQEPNEYNMSYLGDPRQW